MKNNLFESIIKIKGIGPKIQKKLEDKNIFNKIDLLLNLPTGTIDRRFCPKLDQLEIGKISTIFATPIKYNFPRIKRLPSRVTCEDEYSKIDLVFFNTRENYIKQILPLNEEAVISGKVSLYKNKFQITNPDYIRTTDRSKDIKKIMSKYSSISGVSDKTLQKIYCDESSSLPELDEWHDEIFLKKMKWLSWPESLKRLHNPLSVDDVNKNSLFYERLAFDEIFSNLLIFNEIKKRIKKIKKKPKNIEAKNIEEILDCLPFKLTNDQKDCLDEIIKDMKSEKKMMRVLQGDVGSGKTVLALISAYLNYSLGYQSAIMVPTEILALQHFKFFKKIFNNINANIQLLSGKIKINDQKKIRENLKKMTLI